MSQKNDVKKVTIVEFHPKSSGQSSLEEIPEEPVETLSPGFKGQRPLEDYFNVEDLILYLVKIKKSKSRTDLLVSKLCKLIKNKAGLLYAREDTDLIINNYATQIMFSGESLMELSEEVKKLAELGSTSQPQV